MNTPRFIDTNILLYSLSKDPAEAHKRDIAVAVLDADDLALSVQVLQEFYVQATRATRKDALSHEIATGLMRTWLRFRVQETTLPVMLGALEIKAVHRLSYWDAAIVAAARALGCRELLSEGMGHGREVEGILIRDPFRSSRFMRAMLLRTPHAPLELSDIDVPQAGAEQVLLRVRACGVCRTDLHIVDGELDQPKLPLILGHEIVGTVVAVGRAVSDLIIGERVGAPWLGWTDQTCRFCQRGQENLCDHALFTGYTLDGGYAEYVLADERYCLRLPDRYSDLEAAPLLCAGLIGYRTYRLAGDTAEHLGIYGFGAAAHIVAQVAVHQGRRVYAFTRPGDAPTQDFARTLGAVWAGGSDEQPPHELDAALIFAPVGTLVVAALRATAKGGTVVSGGIYMSDIPSFAYRWLWGERVVRSVANLTRHDGAEFMAIAAQMPIQVAVEPFSLAEANAALNQLRAGQVHGAAVLQVAADQAAASSESRGG